MVTGLGFSAKTVRALPAMFLLGVVVPQLLFYLGLRDESMTAGLIAAGGWIVGLQLIDVVRRRLVDPLLLYGSVWTMVQGTVAGYAHSATLYLAGGVIENLIWALVLLGSLAVGRPLLVGVVGSLLRARSDAVLTLPAQAALGRLTTLWALGFLARAVGLYAAVIHLAIGQFLLVNTLAGWPLNGIGLLLSAVYFQAAIRRFRPALSPYAT
jgi:hypothetical protein